MCHWYFCLLCQEMQYSKHCEMTTTEKIYHGWKCLYQIRKKRCVTGPLPLLLIILIAHGIIDGVVHHLLLHVHDFTLFLKLHHDLLNLRKFQLWKQNK